MKIKEITAALEQIAPLCTQESFDNSGLTVGNAQADVASALLCVDVTEDVVEEAVKLGAGLIISHHPLIFNPLRRITDGTYVERAVAMAVRAGVALYACHTNLDAAPGGLSWVLGEALGLSGMRTLAPSPDGATGLGVIGTLPRPIPVENFLATVSKTLYTKMIRYSLPVTPVVSRVAVCSGSGASLIGAAQAAGADIYIASDFKYNNFLDARAAMTLAEVGHFESEYCSIELLHDIIRKKFPTFALHKSREGQNPVHYLVNN